VKSIHTKRPALLKLNGSDSLSDVKKEILSYIKRRGETTISEIAAQQKMSHEGARRQLLLLQKDGWIIRSRRSSAGRAGRPIIYYALTRAGDDLFPRKYDNLAALLIDTLVDAGGESALFDVLRRITDENVKKWAHRLQGKSLEEKLEALKGIYIDQDPFVTVEADGEDLLFIERNCPYLNVAHEKPELCGITVSTLTRLTGRQVKREKKFQNGDRRCTFRVMRKSPVGNQDFRFAYENELQEKIAAPGTKLSHG